MEPLDSRSKETLLNLQVYKVLDEIEEKAREWFVETHVDPKPYIPQEILVRNLLDDLDYMISVGLWWVELGESMGFNMDSKRFLESTIETYRQTNGYMRLVRDERYDPYQNHVRTPEEIKEKQEEIILRVPFPS